MVSCLFPVPRACRVRRDYPVLLVFPERGDPAETMEKTGREDLVRERTNPAIRTLPMRTMIFRGPVEILTRWQQGTS